MVKDHTLTVDIGGIHNVVSIDKVTLARTHQKAEAATGISQCIQVDDKADSENCLALEGEDSDHPPEAEVKKLVATSQRHGVTQYRVRWYDYAPEDDTMNFSKHIPQHFSKRYQTVSNERRNTEPKEHYSKAPGQMWEDS